MVEYCPSLCYPDDIGCPCEWHSNWCGCSVLVLSGHDSRGHYLFRCNRLQGAHITCNNLVCNRVGPRLRRWFRCGQPEPYGLYAPAVHHPDSCLEGNDGRKFVVDLIIVHLPIAPTVTIANPAAVGAAARQGADSKRRQSS